MSIEDYCELCDLPRSTCVHGRPPPAPVAPAPRAPRAATPRTPKVSTARAAAPARPVTRKWTPPDAFRPGILEVLEAAGGALDADDLFGELETLMDEQLTAADREKTPEGELRWRYAARRARQALIAEGLMTKDKPGVWSLADMG